MAEKVETKSSILTIAADSQYRDLGNAIEVGVAKFLKSNSENELVLENFVINAADLAVGGYGKALITVNYTVGKKKTVKK